MQLYIYIQHIYIYIYIYTPRQSSMTMGNPPMGIQMGKCLRGALNVPATRKPSCSDLREKMLVIACGFV